jgi:hypothetical protein
MDLVDGNRRNWLRSSILVGFAVRRVESSNVPTRELVVGI